MREAALIEKSNKPRVVILGGGFGGIELAKALRGVSVQVVVIDRQNFHTFQPLLYQVATAAVEPSSIVHPFRKIFEYQPDFYFRMADALSVNTGKKILETSIGYINYDFLVVATGAITNFYGNAEIQ
ncbi:MAG: FAD-dependent oxidoreductase, partial [Marivirga sp.]|nr:FAD-dependent oxidoreductase [Marivirga sp.]